MAHFALGNIARRRGAWRDVNRHMDNALRFLRRLPAAQILPESEGITAGRLADIINSIKSRKAAA
jgi:chemotaxis protein methyltransferase CheR